MNNCVRVVRMNSSSEDVSAGVEPIDHVARDRAVANLRGGEANRDSTRRGVGFVSGDRAVNDSQGWVRGIGNASLSKRDAGAPVSHIVRDRAVENRQRIIAAGDSASQEGVVAGNHHLIQRDNRT